MISRRTFLHGAIATGALEIAARAEAGPITRDQIGDQVQTLPKGQLPEFPELRSPQVQAAYRYALERGDDLRYIPCFCGCDRFGHGHNRDCYIKAFNPDGTITFTSHAAT